jgi:FKBP-type peptidyl-prolyl cis-trans isomerase SlyD
MRRILGTCVLAATLVVWAAAPSLAQEKDAQGSERAAVENDSRVDIEYTLTDETGEVIDTSKGGKPLTYTHGRRQLIPGLERELLGMRIGEEKRVRVKPEDAYGPIDPTKVVEIAKENIPPDVLEVGARLIARGARGEPRPVTVKEIREKTVVLDTNHPMAGKTLLFDVKILGVTPSEVREPQAGQPAGGAKPNQ